MKRVLSVILSVCMLCSVLCVWNNTYIQAEETLTQVQAVLLDHGKNIRDDALVDSVSADGVGELYNYWDTEDKDVNHHIGRGVSGDQWLIYKLKMPTNVDLQTVSFETYGTDKGSMAMSVDKNTWVEMVHVQVGNFYDKYSVFAFANSTVAPTMPANGEVYVRMKSASADVFYWQGLNVLFYAYGEEYGITVASDVTPTSTNAETEIKAAELSELGRLVDAGGTTTRNPFGNGEMRDVAAGKEVLYYIDLPNGATSYSFSSYYFGTMRLWVSRDKSTWIPLNEDIKQELGGYDIAGTDSILEDNENKAFWLKVTSSQELLYMNLILKYAYLPEQNNPIIPPDPDVVLQTPVRLEVELLNHGNNHFDDALIDSVSADGVGKLYNYWDIEDKDVNHHIGRGVSGDQWLIYKLKLPTNASLQMVSFETFGTTSGTMSVSVDKENWVELQKTALGSFFAERPAYAFAKGKAPEMPENGEIYVRMKSASADVFYWQGLYVIFYQYGEEPGVEIKEGETATSTDGESVINVSELSELGRLVDAGGTTTRNPFGNGEMRDVAAGKEVLYYIDLPNGATSYSFSSYYFGTMRLWVSRDKSTWIPLNEDIKQELGGYDIAGTDSILEDNENKAFWLKVTSSQELLYMNLVLKYVYLPLTEESDGPEVSPTGENIITIQPGLGNELNYLDPLNAATMNGALRLVENTNQLQYIFELPAEATVATLELTLQGDYKIMVSTDGEEYTTLRQAVFRDFTYTTIATMTETLQLSRFLTGEGAKTLYVRLSDGNKEDNAGVFMSKLQLTYYTDGRVATEQQLAKEPVYVIPEVGTDVTMMDCFAPNTEKETLYMTSEGSSTPDNFFGNPCRRLGSDAAVTYKFPYDASATELKLWVQILGANKVEISKDAEAWEKVFDEKLQDIINKGFDATHLLTDNAENAVYMRVSYIGSAGDTSLLLWAGLQSTFTYNGENINVNPGQPVRPSEELIAVDSENGLSIEVPVDAVSEEVLRIEVGGEIVEGGVIYNQIKEKLDASYTNTLIYSMYLCDQELNAVNLKKAATVTMEVPYQFDAEDVDVFLYDTQTHTLTKLNATVNGENLVFETMLMDHLILASKSSISSNTGDYSDGSSDNAEDSVNTGVISYAIFALCALLASAGVIFFCKRRARASK